MSGSSNDDSVDPFGHLLDLVLYAPIGLIAKGIDSLPDLAKQGRSNATNARVIGQFALGATNSKARKALSDAEQHLSAFLKIIVDSAEPSRQTKGGASEKSEVAEPDSSESSVDLIIDGYESMNATQILPLLSRLSPDQLRKIEIFESNNRARKTVLNRLSQLQG